MKLFRCSCETSPILYFENVQCGSCGRLTGFCPDYLELRPFTPVESEENAESQGAGQAGSNASPVWQDDEGRKYIQCANWTQHQVCNWMLPLSPADNDQAVYHFSTDPDGLCPACRLNEIIPDLSVAANVPLWHALEKAKRRCLFTLLELRLPVASNHDPEDESTPPPLSFRFMSDKDATTHFQRPLKGEEPVLTGHADGVITINLAEADDIARVQTRVAMQERYRTLLGHFRHECGHYYWDVFKVVDNEFVDAFRAVFGDETASYQEALDRHYEQGPPSDWQNDFVSTYATMHPWEDWAETWAHYLHIIDTLETQQSFSRTSEVLSDSVRQVGLPFAVGSRDNTAASDFDAIMDLWIDASIVLNSLNRSMGLPDPYPFVLHKPIQDKLRFVHDTIKRFDRVSAQSAAGS
ncbi:zinc-binding metallopeptidase family protein [Allohahella sp. A8]|uniref:zinc-binding metallopeptidase family protein n=1 Tax=Allohahella sp. A8 TaxID=3141461 RepID=UPI003A7F92DD